MTFDHDIIPPPGIPRFNHAVPPLAHIVTGSGRSGPVDCPLPWRCAGVARPAERGAARRSRRDGHLSVRALRAIESATGNNLVGLIFARDRLNLKEFTAELAESRRTSTDQIRQRDDWPRDFRPTALARAKKWAGSWPEGCRAAHCFMHRWGRSQCVRTGSRDREAVSRDAAHCPSLAHRQGQAGGRTLRRACAWPGRKRPDCALDQYAVDDPHPDASVV